VILAVHSALAALTTVREFELEEDEARKLSNASKEVLRYYPIGMSDKALAWTNLAVVACGIYGTRIMAYSVRRAAERRARIVTLPSSGTASPPGSQPQPAASKVNGYAGAGINLDDLTPPWMAVAPENEVIP
jgi:hypothetical protein